jgi:hypothetical protein
MDTSRHQTSRLLRYLTVFLMGLFFLPNALSAQDVEWNASKKEKDEIVVEKILSRDNDIQLVLTPTHLIFSLSDSLKQSIHDELDDAVDEEDSDFGAMIAAAVTGALKETLPKALDFRLKCELNKIETMSYEDGEIKLYYRSGVEPCFDDDMHLNGHDYNDKGFDDFSRTDALRLIAAFKTVRQP